MLQPLKTTLFVIHAWIMIYVISVAFTEELMLKLMEEPAK